MDRGVRTAALTAGLALAAAGACREVPPAEAARTPYERLAADSAADDSAAFAALPDGLAATLDVRPLLQDPAVRGTLPTAECAAMTPPRPEEHRRRLSLRLPDSTSIVLYAAADRTTGTLERVEFIRRTPRRGQRGLIWDQDADRTSSMWWPEFDRGIRRADRGPIPRGSPVNRALRALGRQLLTIPCADSVSAP